ncbi:hypothetical protein KEM54_006376 [Ascosphaera aggregata]|nr:hypothetical protein KEM54_006376 [Ascosphaera aggregata]
MLLKYLLLSTVAALVAGVSAGDAPVVTGSTFDFFTAEPHARPGSIAGKINFAPGPSGKGVQVDLVFDYFKDQSVIYYYHIHENPIPADGNCLAAGNYLDPYNGDKNCNPTQPAACQIGDLSGKHGALNQTSAAQEYIDDYLSTNQVDKAFVGGRSLVIHDANMKPITCANITGVGYNDNPTRVKKARLPVRFSHSGDEKPHRTPPS